MFHYETDSSDVEFGIQLRYCSNITLSNNTLLGPRLGISLWKSCNCSILSNTHYGNGMNIAYSSMNNTVQANSINHGGLYGIWMGRDSNNNTITRNRIRNITNSTKDYYGGGIRLDGGSNNRIFNNTIENNDYGLFLTDKSNRDNLIYHNNFIDNTNQVSSRLSDGNTVIWNLSYPGGGNYWSDWKGADRLSGKNQNKIGSDGIGDEPYQIPNNEKNDEYPFTMKNGWLNRRLWIIWNVDDDAPDGGNGSKERPFNSIQDALNASFDGDTIHVWEGVYFENVVVNRTVNLIGNGSVNTTIEGVSDGNVVSITADWCSMSGFSVSGSGNWEEAAIKIESDHNQIIDNNCSNTNYAGIYLYRAEDCLIQSNDCWNNTWGIYLNATNHTILEENNCSENVVGINTTHSNYYYYPNSRYNIIRKNYCTKNIRGIALSKAEDVELNNNICNDNKHGIWLKGCYYNLSGNTCSRNTWSGVTLAKAYYVALTDNQIDRNLIGVEVIHSGSCSAHYNNIHDNSRSGMEVSDTSSRVNATHNWWGEGSGPYHPTKNPDGKGDNVTDRVLFDPWTGPNGMAYNVDKDRYYDAIQDAIDDADEGDEIRVYAGLYYENIIIDKAIKLIGNGSDVTTIDGGGRGDVVRIIADWVNISGFRIQNSGDLWADAGIAVQASNTVITRNHISNHYDGIYLDHASNTIITGNTISSNFNGSIGFSSSSNTIISNNTISNNDNGIDLISSIHTTIEGNNISNNINGINILESSGIIITGNTIHGNTEYGIYVCVFENNGPPINATHNWWGHVSGPYHPTNNTDGKGDNVTDYVIFDPWLTEPVNQETHKGRLSGFVTDAFGGPLEGVNLRIEYHETVQVTYSYRNGYYSFWNIPDCECLKKVMATKTGYQAFETKISIGENTIEGFDKPLGEQIFS